MKCPVCKKDNIRINSSRVFTCVDCGHNADKDIFEFEGLEDAN